MTKFKYPTPHEIIEFNKLILKEIKVKKADKPELLSYLALSESVNACEKAKGSIYEKAAALLKNLIQRHPFASGNRRTAFAITERFLIDNGAKLKISNEAINAETLKGLREGYYSDEEIKNWLKTGAIRKFER